VAVSGSDGPRCLTKPRGYAGDYATINMIYFNEASGDGRTAGLWN